MDFRLLNSAFLPQAAELWDYCFEKKGDPFYEWYFSEYCLKQNSVIGGFDGDKLACMLHLNPYAITLRGQTLRLPYIVGVATAPEYRGQHLTRPLLETAFTVLRAQGAAFALLMPINPAIYKPYGFDYCYYRHYYQMPLAELKKLPPVHNIKITRCADITEGLDELTAVYEACGQELNGMAVRSREKWQELLNGYKAEKVMLAIAFEDASPSGYMLYSLDAGTFKVQELLTLSHEAQTALLRYAAGHLSDAANFEWLAEPGNMAYLNFAGSTYSGSLKPFMMARCINIRKALELLPVPQNVSGEAVLLITDKFLPLNNGLLKITAQNGALTQASTIENEEITMDSAAFTQLYFGTFSFEELVRAGKIKVHNPRKSGFLQALFTKCRNYINEYY